MSTRVDFCAGPDCPVCHPMSDGEIPLLPVTPDAPRAADQPPRREGPTTHHEEEA